MQIRAALVRDIDQVVELHRSAFRGFFLETLGEGFLRELYWAFLRSDTAVFLVALDGDVVAGFVVGTIEPKSFFQKLLINRWHVFLRVALGAWLKRPLFVTKKMWSALSYRGDQPAHLDGALLSSLAVSPTRAGQGIGRALVEDFCDAVAARDKNAVYLVTDRDSNDRVNHFYLSCGFAPESTFKKSGNRWVNRYLKSTIKVAYASTRA